METFEQHTKRVLGEIRRNIAEETLRNHLVYGNPYGNVMPYDLDNIEQTGRYVFDTSSNEPITTGAQILLAQQEFERRWLGRNIDYVNTPNIEKMNKIIDYIKRTNEVEGEKIQDVCLYKKRSGGYTFKIYYTFSIVSLDISQDFVDNVILVE